MVNIQATDCTPDTELGDEILLSEEPIILRGLVAHWPIVQRGLDSNAAAADYFAGLYGGRPVTVVRGEPETGGRVAYNDDLSSLNCLSAHKTLPEALQLILGQSEVEQPLLYYVGTTLTNSIMPGFRAANDLNLSVNANQYIWLGNRSCIPAHFDLPDNIACNVVGRRRFTLFPPNQLENLYVGPLDFTPAGQAISLVDIRKPDLEKFPRYTLAREQARIAELEPGDALFLPSMWWHHVEGLDDLNVLINYWWRQSPNYLSSPQDVLDLALLSIRDLPPREKAVWKQMLNYYVFNDDQEAFDHIPTSARGSLGPIDETIARKVRAKVLSRLNR